MTLAEAGTVGGILMTIIGICGFVLGNNNSTNNTKSRFFQRLDEVKKDIEDKFVQKNVCEMQHKYTNEKLESIEKKVDKLLERNGIR
jgi:hypothetical protein